LPLDQKGLYKGDIQFSDNTRNAHDIRLDSG